MCDSSWGWKVKNSLPKRSYWDCPQPHEAITMVTKLIFVVWYSMVFSRKENTSCTQYIQSTDVARTPCIAGCQAHGTCPGYIPSIGWDLHCRLLPPHDHTPRMCS